MKIHLPAYWNNRYKNETDYWSLNNPNSVFVQLLEDEKFIPQKDILILGSALGHDSKVAAQKGFKVTGLDFSQYAVTKSRDLCAGMINKPNFICMDLFNLISSDLKFTAVYEYTTICSFPPDRIDEFLTNIDSVLEYGGVFITILFPIKTSSSEPPFLIDWMMFNKSAEKYWKLKYYQKDINSIKPRKNNELLLIYSKV